MNIWLRTPNLEFCSWSIVYKHLYKALRGVVNLAPSHIAPPENSEDYIELFWGDPAQFAWATESIRFRAALVLSEHNVVPRYRTMVENLKGCELLLCPCQASAAAYRESPLNLPIYYSGLGVDAGLTYIDRDWDNGFNFLLGGAAQFRKGSWLAVEAFANAYNEMPDATLTVASYAPTDMYKELQVEYSGYDRIKFVSFVDDIADYYRNAHVLVSPHLSEGWGLMIPEAMATGMPALVARCSAPLEYFSQDYGWWAEMSELYAPVKQCIPGVSGSWRLPSVDSISDRMVYAYNHRDECKDKGKAASEYVANNLTWTHVVERIVGILDDHIANNAGL